MPKAGRVRRQGTIPTSLVKRLGSARGKLILAS
jgi:hypothetical protein